MSLALLSSFHPDEVEGKLWRSGYLTFCLVVLWGIYNFVTTPIQWNEDANKEISWVYNMLSGILKLFTYILGIGLAVCMVLLYIFLFNFLPDVGNKFKEESRNWARNWRQQKQKYNQSASQLGTLGEASRRGQCIIF